MDEDQEARFRLIVREEINRFRRRVMLVAWVICIAAVPVGLLLKMNQVAGLAGLGVVVTPFLLLLRGSPR